MKSAQYTNQLGNTSNQRRQGELTLNNGTQWLVGSTNPEWIRGLSNIGLIICRRKSNFWSDKEQSPEASKFLNAINAPSEDQRCRRHKLEQLPTELTTWHYGLMHSNSKRWQKLVIDIYEGAEGLYTPEEVKEIMAEGTPGQNEQEFYVYRKHQALKVGLAEMDEQDFVNIAEGLEERNPEDD